MPRSKSRIEIRRAYDPPDGGYRVLVDRLWPRGVSKETARLDEWIRELAPGTELRKWFAHDPRRWGEFQRRYRGELAVHRDLLERLLEISRREPLILVYAARDEERNNAIVIRAVLEEMGG